MRFQDKLNEDERSRISAEIIARYPDRVPIICEPKKGSEMTIDKVKFLAPRDYKMGHFLITLRNRVGNVRSSDALYVFCNDVVAPAGKTVGEIYEDRKDKDGLLYFVFDKESTFG